MILRSPALTGALLVGLFALGGCGSQAVAPRADTVAASSNGVAELEHIHGLGEDPKTGELFVATHYGLFRAPRGQTQLRRAGSSRQDTMGFSVVDSGRFLGSGHPDPAAGGPPALGLIASSDQGRTWTTLSLPGKADFHVLRSSGRQVYGSDSGSGKIMASDDGGHSWASRTPPADVYDLAIDPETPRHVVAATAKGIFSSSDAGGRWKLTNGGLAGLLAWPKARELVLVEENGAVSRSADAGRTFKATGGTIGTTPAAFAGARSGLLAALGDGTVLGSDDAGASWQVRGRP